MQSLSEKLIALCSKLQYTIASCESVTGGLFASEIIGCEYASTIMKGSVVAYNNEVKEQVVKVPKEILTTFGAVSVECAKVMAENTKVIFKSNICVSFTGNASVNVMEAKQTGLIYSCIIINETIINLTLRLSGTRNEIRKQAVEIVLNEIIKNLGI